MPSILPPPIQPASERGIEGKGLGGRYTTGFSVDLALDLEICQYLGYGSAREVLIMAELAERITVNPAQCGGRPCIRGMRIRVIDVLDLLAAGLTQQQVLKELPDLEAEDISACLRFASSRLNHPILAA